MPDMMPEFRPADLENFKAPILEGLEKPKIEDEGWSPVQKELANTLQEAFTQQKDSLDSNIHDTPQARLADPVQTLTERGVKLDPESRTLQYKDHTFKLPESLVVGEGGQIHYRPSNLSERAAGRPLKSGEKRARHDSEGLEVPVELQKNPPKPKPGDIKPQAVQPKPEAKKPAEKSTIDSKSNRPNMASDSKAAEKNTLSASKSSTKESTISKSSNEEASRAATAASVNKAKVSEAEEKINDAVAQFGGNLASAAAVGGAKQADSDAQQQQQRQRSDAQTAEQVKEASDPTKIHEAGKTKAGDHKQ